MEEEKIAPEAGANNAPAEQVDNSAAAPAGQKEAEEIKGLDPRIVEIVGKEKIESAFGEQPGEDKKPAEEKKEVPNTEPKKDDQPGAATEEKTDVPPITPPDRKPSRLDRSIARHYIANLHLMGEKNIPTEEEVLADLKNVSREERIEALHFHRLKEKELRGEKNPGDELDEEDSEAIKEEEREAIRNEILQEEHEKKVMGDFVKFLGDHTELLPDNDPDKKDFKDAKPYDPVLAEAVETLLKGGMTIDRAYETVTKQIQAVKDAREAEEKKNKSAALSGVLSGNGQVTPTDKQFDWDDVDRISKEDPPLYRKMLAEGKFKHLT